MATKPRESTQLKGTAKRAPVKPRTRTTRPMKDKLSTPWGRYSADRWVVYWRLVEGATWHEIVKRDGRTKSQLERVVKGYEEHGEPDEALVGSMRQNPVELVEGAIERIEVLRTTGVVLVREASNVNEAVGALRTLLRVEQEHTRLMQAIGKLPNELGTIRFLVETRELAQELTRLLDGLDDGSLTTADVRRAIGEWAGALPAPADSPPTINGQEAKAA